MRGLLVFACAATLGAADLTFTLPPGGQRMTNQMTGKVVALELGYSTCEPCKAESERLSKLASEFGPQGFEAYSVAFDLNARAMSEAAAESAAGTRPGLPLGWANARDVRTFLGMSATDRLSVPQVVLLDRSGQVRFKTAAEGSDELRTEAALRTKIQELIAPPSAPAPPTGAKSKKVRR